MRNRSIAGPLALAALALAGWALAWPWYGGSEPLLEYSWPALVRLGGVEARVDAASLVADLAVASGLLVALVRCADAGDEEAAGGADEASPKRVPSWRSRLRELAGAESSSKTAPFVVVAQGHGASGELWSGQYFWGHPALLAVGLALGSPWLASAAALFVAVIFTGHLYKETSEIQDPRGAILATSLVATSPLVIFTAGTLHGCNVALACGAVGMWGLARLSRGPSLRAALALGFSTALALHVRPFDHLALLVGLAVAIVLRELGRDDIDRTSALRGLGGVVRRLGLPIAIAVPFVLLHALLNRAVSGDWRHSGYWMFNEGHGWQTFGFGRGPFGDRHSIDVAAAKTFAVLVRGLFSFLGGPLPFVFVLAPPASLRRSRELPHPSREVGSETKGAPLRVGAVLAVYGVAYFFYAASPIHLTGPVYYEPLIPVIAVAVSQAAIRTYDHLKVLTPRLSVAVPAAFLANVIAGAAIFAPPVAREIAYAADHAQQCEALAAEVAHDGPALIFVAPPGSAQTGWSLWPPLPSPTFDDAALFPLGRGREADMAVQAELGAGRKTYLASCVRTEEPSIGRYDPATGATRSITEAP